MSELRPFTLNLERDQYQRLLGRAHGCGSTITELIRDAIDHMLDTPAAKAEPLTRDVWKADFTALEERIMARMDGHPLFITEVRIDDEIDPDLAKRFQAEVKRLSDKGCMCAGGRAGFRTGGYTPASPTGRIGEGSEMLRTGRDMPVSGLNTLATLHVVNDVAQSRVEVKINDWALKPLDGQEWVITGSLETMTRDRAREILMELGATVSGAVTQKTSSLIWGPGAGSKKAAAEKHGTQQLDETQFIKFIRRHGVDMPLPTDEKAAPLPPGDGWHPNKGNRPVLSGAYVEFKRRDGIVRTELARHLNWCRPGIESWVVSWRLAK
ncbi:hypothetical protein GOD54_23510 [Sinorhizobium medicae]|nr:hypothetical protein [Sinorhizobium medicae]